MAYTQNQAERLQMDDILIPHAELSAFTVTLDETTRKILEDTDQRQQEVLKLKEVNEEQLRTVVKL